jgi:hypothetical protein
VGIVNPTVQLFRLTLDGDLTIRRTYGGAALYESLRAAKSARAQMSRGKGLRIQQLFAGMADVDHLVWEDVEE